ncbi:unnamed protein product [Pedinophyceae sp. YPF-701]|nr:unnamed protein product [Pedinophyceae sp. YPF-701]
MRAAVGGAGNAAAGAGTQRGVSGSCRRPAPRLGCLRQCGSSSHGLSSPLCARESSRRVCGSQRSIPTRAGAKTPGGDFDDLWTVMPADDEPAARGPPPPADDDFDGWAVLESGPPMSGDDDFPSPIDAIARIAEEHSVVDTDTTTDATTDDDDDDGDDGDDDDVWTDVLAADAADSGGESEEEIFSVDGGWQLDGAELASILESARLAEDEDELADRGEDYARAAAALVASMGSGAIADLGRQQQEAQAEKRALSKLRHARGSPNKIHRRLRIIAGAAAGKAIYSPQDDRTRPMMEKVRAAVFSMLLSQVGPDGRFPPGVRWLDLYAGTGSVGLEAASRGVEEVHFVEMDPWVINRVLGPNIKICGAERAATVHNAKAEAVLARAEKAPRSLGGPFDFLSACPPYEKVSWPEMMAALDRTPLLHDRSFCLVEYPQKEWAAVPDSLGPLVKFRDRRYGRTYLALYGPEDLVELDA